MPPLTDDGKTMEEEAHDSQVMLGMVVLAAMLALLLVVVILLLVWLT